MVTVVVAAVLSYVLVFPEKRLALRFGFVDLPDVRRKHQGIRPRLGGVGMLVAFLAALAATGQPFHQKIVGLLLGAGFCVAVGIVDDKRRPRSHELRAAPQFLTQIAAAGIAVAAGVTVSSFRDPRAGGPFGALIELPLWIAAPLTLFWIVGMMNTVNFLDGMDGLAGGVVAIGAAVLAFVSMRLGQQSVALQCLALTGVAIGFLPHNVPPARTFMGTTGAWFLGYMLATLAIIGGAKLATALLVVGIPVFDVALLIVVRTIRGQPFWQGDRSHLFHRLLDLGLSQRITLLLYYCLSAAFGAYALAFTSTQSSGWGLKIYGLAALVAVTVLILGLLTRKRANSTH